MSPAMCLKGLAVAGMLFSAINADRSTCNTICEHIHDPHILGSLTTTIHTSISNGGSPNILIGHRDDTCAGYYHASAVWTLWAKALEADSGSSVSHLQETGNPEDAVCVDKAILAKLTAAASKCHSQSTGGSGSSMGSMRFPPSDQTVVDNSASSGHGGSSGSQVVHDGGQTIISSGGSSSSSSSHGSTSHSSSGWSQGNVNAGICFKVKDKRSDRYLTSGGSEYAFAFYPNYYSIFRAYPSKTVEGGFTVTEVNRSGAKVNYPVKVSDYYSSFKPLTGDKDAIWSFNPAQFGDTCWGTPGKKMDRRHDWGGWGDNYRFSTSTGDDCADVELEEADC